MVSLLACFALPMSFANIAGLVVMMAVFSFPLALIPCRQNLFTLFGAASTKQISQPVHVAVTLALVCTAYGSFTLLIRRDFDHSRAQYRLRVWARWRCHWNSSW
jgi:hypothetical protein